MTTGDKPGGLPPPIEAVKAQLPGKQLKEISPTGNNNCRAVDNLNSSYKAFN